MKGYKTCLFALFVLMSFGAMAQKDFRQGFIINQNGDTTFGYLDYKESWVSYDYCHFRNNLSSETKVYHSTEIAGYGFKGDKAFITRVFLMDTLANKKENIFMEVLVRGRLNLYLFKGRSFFEKDSSGLYVLERESKEVEQNGRKYILWSVKNSGIFQMFLSDCEVVKSRLKYITTNVKQLSEIVIDYNNCGKEKVVVEYKAGKKWTKVNIGLLAGVQRSNLTFSSQYEYFNYLTKNTFSTNSIFPTVFFDISSPRFFEKLYFQISLSYIKRNFYSDIKTETNTTIERDENYINISTIKLPLGFKYQFPSKSIRPHFQVGVVGYYNTSKSSSRVFERHSKTQQTIHTTKTESFDMKKSYLGIHAGLGASKKINNRISLLIEARYERENAYSYYLYEEPVQSKINSFILNTGIVF